MIRSVTTRGTIQARPSRSSIIVRVPEEIIISQTEQAAAAEAALAEAIELRSTANVTIIVPGSQGVPGPPGQDGLGEPFVQQIDSPSSEWIVNHNLGRQVSVEVTDLAGDEFICEVTRPTNNQVRVLHSSPQTGIVIIT